MTTAPDVPAATLAEQLRLLAADADRLVWRHAARWLRARADTLAHPATAGSGPLRELVGRDPLICSRPNSHPGAHGDAWGAEWINEGGPGSAPRATTAPPSGLVRILVDAAERLLMEWSEADNRRRNWLRVELGRAADEVRDALDAEPAQIAAADPLTLGHSAGPTEPATERTGPNPGGPWTRHGHPIHGITVVGDQRPPIARCGGPGLCGKCRDDEQRIRAERGETS